MPYPVSGTPGEIYIDPTSGDRYQFDAVLSFWQKIPAVAGSITHETIAIATNGQTAFTLSVIPTDALSVVMNVNGVNYYQPDFTIAGALVTWAGPITLATTDKLVITYV